MQAGASEHCQIVRAKPLTLSVRGLLCWPVQAFQERRDGSAGGGVSSLPSGNLPPESSEFDFVFPRNKGL